MRPQTTARGAALLLSAALGWGLVPSLANGQTFPRTVARPNSRGDQVLFYYDVRDHFTTFVTVRNVGSTDLHVNVQFYGPDLGAPFSQDLTIPATPGDAGEPANGGLATIDVGSLKASGLPAQAGVAIATGVDANGQPIVTRAVAGNFTVANLLTGAAWGSPGAARSAIQNGPLGGSVQCPTNPPAPKPGTVVDGANVAFTPIQPGSADLVSYYNPDTLAPVADGGNQLIFITLEDQAGVPYRAKPGTTTWFVSALRNTGAKIPSKKFTTTGVAVSDLASVIGPGVAGASGSVLFTADADTSPLTRLVFFTEALGTFGTGYLLPRK